MKYLTIMMTVILVSLSLAGCAPQTICDITATTLPVYEFTKMLCDGTGLRTQCLITENVSCLHDYTLKVDEMRMLEQSHLVVISGFGFEDFIDDILNGSKKVIDSSLGIEAITTEDHNEVGHNHSHAHASDPHIWLSPTNAKTMAKNICVGLSHEYPEYQSVFEKNLLLLQSKLDQLITYAEENLDDLSTRKIITFHDGFSYMADAFSIEILHAIEEESGSEASAAELIELIGIVTANKLPAIFTERNGSTSAANIIASETGCSVYALDMAISGNSYFEAMYYNINILKEALE